jgi:hypothetical protein
MLLCGRSRGQQRGRPPAVIASRRRRAAAMTMASSAAGDDVAVDAFISYLSEAETLGQGRAAHNLRDKLQRYSMGVRSTLVAAGWRGCWSLSVPMRKHCQPMRALQGSMLTGPPLGGAVVADDADCCTM